MRMTRSCSVPFTDRMDFPQGRFILLIFSLLTLISVSSAQVIHSTPWFCTDTNALDSNVEISGKLPSCPLGHGIEIEDVIYESTVDGTCSSNLRCTVNNKNTLEFACNGKQTCDVNIRQFRFQINSTCGPTVRFFAKFRCSPLIYERKSYFCEISTNRNPTQGDLQVSCEQNFRLHIQRALIGISVKPRDSSSQTRWQCDQNTYSLCHSYISDAYRNVCDAQLNRNSQDRCLIRYSDRPQLRNCPHGSYSNFSIVEYMCIPDEGIFQSLPRFDVCSNEYQDWIPVDRGILHSPSYPNPMGKYLSCQKRLYVRRQSRLRLFMLEKSMEYYHEFAVRLTKSEPNIVRRLEKNGLIDMNFTKDQEETVEIELKTNHLGGGDFLLYFQIDSRISNNVPLVLENDRKTIDSSRRQKLIVKRDWGVVIGCLIGLLLVFLLVLIVIIAVRLLKCRRADSLQYMRNRQNDDDNKDRSKASRSQPMRETIQIEHPHLSSTSKIMAERISDRESLLQQGSSAHLKNSLKPLNDEQCIVTDLTLGYSSEQPAYLDARPVNSHRNDQSLGAIRDHRENESRYRRPAPLASPEQDKRRLTKSICDAPMASTETLDVGTTASSTDLNRRPKQAPPKVPPPRLDLAHPKPSAPPIHLLHQENLQAEHPPTHQRIVQLQQLNQRNPHL